MGTRFFVGRPTLIIREGGTYSGLNFSSDVDAPLIHVGTTEPVIIEDSQLVGRSTLITAAGGADVTIRRTRATVRPSLTPGSYAGRFVTLSAPTNVSIEGCVLDGTAGIYILSMTSDGSPGNRLIIRGNRVRDVRGNKSDGTAYTTERALRQFVQLDKCAVPNGEIAWNEVINEPGQSSPEDVINIYQSGGTPASPLLIHHNFIQGAYPPDPANNPYSGGGILLGDGNPGGHDTIAEHNIVLDTSNHGIGIAGGQNNIASFNRVLSAGTLPDGTPIASQNVGIYAWDSGDSGTMSGIEVTDNTVGWVNTKPAYPSGRNDYYLPDANVNERNTNYAQPPTRALYGGEHAAWLASADGEIDLPPLD